MTMFQKKVKETKKTTVDINRAGEIAEQLQVFFSKNNITPMEALASMMILTEFLKRQMNVLPEDYNKLLEMLAKVK
jgi:hypothetical protein